MDQATERIARILRADKHSLEAAVARLEEVSGKKGILAKIVEENDLLMKEHMTALGVTPEASSKDIYDALISKIESDDNRIFQALGAPSCKNHEHCISIALIAKKVVNPPKGLFLKKERAQEFLLKSPPQKVMEFLKYTSVEEMVSKENVFELYAALRIIEGAEWLNSVFFKQYEGLTSEDFEEREIEVLALSPKWDEAASAFVEKKKHNVSHLKELGVVFVIPAMVGISGEVLRMFVLLMHYLYEVPFYASIVAEIIKGEDFPARLSSLLRGDVLETRPEGKESGEWLVIQRYLAKDDPNDWRLFAPHVNPEALHWLKAEEHLFELGEAMDGFAKELRFWQDLSWVGDYYKDESGVEVLVSFNLVDTVMSLVKQKEMVKYLYHQEEALWNKIFAEAMGREGLEEYSKKNLLKGYFQI